ncbi:MAG: linear amide C-N hydrolase [Deltaproteobacteria bacterium]|nr:linear amide C-N hydrolase [Deltaproteobacteria bacterium]
MEKKYLLLVLPLLIAALMGACLLPGRTSSCTIFPVKTKDTALVGRNFDWSEKGGRIRFIPSAPSKNSMALLEQISEDMPFEGMNDKGLFVGMAAVPETEVPFSLFKTMVKSLELIKIILSHASTVEESLGYFSKYTVLFGETFGNPLIHYMVADQSGDSAVIEFFENEVIVIKRTKGYQLMTNHYLTDPQYGSISASSKNRFEIVKAGLDSRGMSNLEGKDIVSIL